MNKKMPIIAILGAFMLAGCGIPAAPSAISSIQESIVSSGVKPSEQSQSKTESSVTQSSEKQSSGEASSQKASSVIESSQKASSSVESSQKESSLAPSSSITSSKDSSVSSSVAPTGYTTISTVLEEVGTKSKEECTKSYKIRGTIDEITSEKYKDFYINDSTGRLLIYGLDKTTGSAYTPAVGDEIAVEGIAFYFTDTKNPDNSGVEIKNAVLLDYPGKPSSSSSSQSSVSSIPSSSISSTSSSVAPSGDVIVGKVAASDLLSATGYQTASKTVAVGGKNITFEINDCGYNNAYTSVGTIQFAKKGHDSHTSTLVIKSATVKTVKLTVHGYQITDGEDGLALSLEGATFSKTNTSISVEKSVSTYTVSFTLDTAKSGDITISNNITNARYVSEIEFIA